MTTRIQVDVTTGETAVIPLTPEEIADAEARTAAEIAAQASAEAPIIITNRQLFAALALSGLITEAEALAAGRVGEVPAAIDAIFAALPDPQQAFLARLTWATMREVPRDHSLITVMIAAELATAAQVDAMFALGASL